nr:hypothetical protein [Tessaracoccus coleopterorum]
MAVGSHDGTVHLVDLQRGSVKKIGRSEVGSPPGSSGRPTGATSCGAPQSATRGSWDGSSATT